jgi:NADH-quinone oxidoreductase subunit H
MLHLIQSPVMQTYVLPAIYAVIVILALPLLAGCVSIAERQFCAYLQGRRSNSEAVKPGLWEPITEVTKLLMEEDATPSGIDPLIFWAAPLLSLMVALLAFSVMPIGPAFHIADLNIGLLFIFGIGSIAVHGVVLGGWASSTQNSMTSALSATAQLIVYGTVTILAVLSALLLSGSLSMKEIVQAQLDRGQWFIFYVPVGFAAYFLGSLPITTLASFDSSGPGKESDTAYMSAYTGFRRCLYLLAGYANVILVACIATIVFLGGWLRPLASYRDRFPGTSVELLDALPAIVMMSAGVYFFWRARRLTVNVRRAGAFSAAGLCVVAAALLLGALFTSESFMQGVHGAFWFVVKVCAYIYFVFWFRFEFLTAHRDKLSRLEWRMLIPVALVNLITAAIAILTSQDTGLPMRLTTLVATAATLGVVWWLFKNSLDEPAAVRAGGE